MVIDVGAKFIIANYRYNINLSIIAEIKDMKIIDKYICKEFIIPFSYCFFAFVLLFIIGDLFENLDDFIKQKLPWQIIGKYYLFLIPTIFIWTTPLAVLLSLLYQLGYMSRYNELSALKASGVSFWRIMAPFVIIGIIFTFLMFGVNERLVPRCTAEMDYVRNVYIKKKKDAGGPEKVKKIIFFSSAYNMSFYIDKIDRTINEAENISNRKFHDDGTLKMEWYGERGKWLDNSWWLFNGYTRKFDQEGSIAGGVQFFEKKELAVNVPPQDLIYSQSEMMNIGAHMNFQQLRNYMRRNYTKGTLPQDLVVDLYRKLSMPVTVLVVTLFGIAFGARISRGGALASVGASIGFYLVYYGASSFLLALGKLGKLIPALAVWTPHLVFAIIGGFLLKKTN